jgi:RHH-type proline utilization regulon transcriptional repressor/proline dehydrogenase/delta 1-pyrroline-5-carboxylate dehydrogenase
MTDRIYPQFATHNAHTVAAILSMAPDRDCFEFQRLHGMGEQLHETVRKAEGTRCRIYAPVGAHSDLLAYLVRRLLENGANSSFVHQLTDEAVPPEAIARDPLEIVETQGPAANPKQSNRSGHPSPPRTDGRRSHSPVPKARAAHAMSSTPPLSGRWLEP